MFPSVQYITKQRTATPYLCIKTFNFKFIFSKLLANPKILRRRRKEKKAPKNIIRGHQSSFSFLIILNTVCCNKKLYKNNDQHKYIQYANTKPTEKTKWGIQLSTKPVIVHKDRVPHKTNLLKPVQREKKKRHLYSIQFFWYNNYLEICTYCSYMYFYE